MEQVKLWIANDDRTVTPLRKREQVDLEQHLEEMLIDSPEMLGDDVRLVGRQLMTAGGPLDLLGIDSSGKLVIYELKRGLAPREALIQAVDYASWIDSLAYDELARRISDHRPSGFERDFDDFDDWYSDQFDEDQVRELRPARIVVVGLGMEPATERMAKWLADKGVNIEVLTFQAFEHLSGTLLARQVEVASEDVVVAASGSTPSRPDPERRAEEFQAVEAYRMPCRLLESAFAGSRYAIHTFKNGVNYALPPTDDRKVRRYPGYVGVFVRTESTGMINLVIRPTAAEICTNEAEQLKSCADQSGAQTWQSPSDRSIWIAVDLEMLGRLDAHITEFAKSAIEAWQQNYDRWLAAQAEPAIVDSSNSTERSTV